MKWKIFFTIFLIIAISGFAVFMNGGKIRDYIRELKKRELPESVSYEEARKNIALTGGQAETVDVISVEGDLQMPAAENQPASPAKRGEPEAASIPDKINLNIPFTPQAPFAVWDAVHEDACEEASAVMAAHFVLGRSIPDAAYADEEILKIVDWEKSNFGFWVDTDAKKTAEILQRFYGLKDTEAKYDITADDIRDAVGRGYPVILPLYGRGLNPYFSGGGPLYHMIVVRGYTEHGQLITNDPGTKRGENYVYDAAFLMDRIHDWNGGDVLNGKKAMIIVKQ